MPMPNKPLALDAPEASDREFVDAMLASVTYTVETCSGLIDGAQTPPDVARELFRALLRLQVLEGDHTLDAGQLAIARSLRERIAALDHLVAADERRTPPTPS